MIQLPTFKNPKMEELAFTHRSYLNESKMKESNERLEFLGDSILSYVVSNHLYKNYPFYDEGILTNLRSLVVNTKSLAKIAKELNFGKRLLLSRGEEDSGGRDNKSLLANTYESFVGALYIDQGIDAASDFIEKTIIPTIAEYDSKKVFKDPKSLLQEYVQSRKKNSPEYRVLEEEGPPHNRIFTIGAFVDQEKAGQGTGKSKQSAEEKAAAEALDYFKKKTNPTG